MNANHSHYKPKVAVLLAAYNGKKWIKEQIDSILNQDKVNVSLYISIDFSSDGTYEFVFSEYGINKNIIVLPYGEKFGSAGANFIRLFRDVDFSSYDFIALSDQDDIWMPYKLSRAYEKMINKTIGAVSSNVIAFWPNGRELIIKKSYPQRALDYLFESAGPGCTFVLRNEVANKVKAFFLDNEEKIKNVYLHDWLIYAFCRQNNINWLIDEEASMYYRQHECNSVGANIGFSAYISRLRKINDGWYSKQVKSVASAISFPDRNKLSSRLYLIRNFNKIRRRRRDQIILLLAVMLGLFHIRSN